MNPRLTQPTGTNVLEQRLLEQMAEVRSFLQRLVGRGSPTLDADDLVQDVMERALRYSHTFDEQRDLLPWLRRTAFRVFLDERERSRRRPVTGQDGLPEPSSSQSAEAAQAAANRDEVEHHLAALGAIERQVLCRFHRDGWSVSEISVELGMPAGTVKSHLHRARRRLAEGRPTPAAPHPEQGGKQ